MNIRVLLADDQALLRGSLTEVLSRDPELEVVAACSSGNEAIALATSTQPDVALLDIDMPGLDGLQTAEQLSQTHPEIRVLILTVLARPGYLRRALAGGAVGFILKDTPPSDLVDAIKRTHRGERVVDSTLAVQALSHGASPLSERETEVLSLTRSTPSTKALARELHLSDGTVRNTLSSAMRKLDAASRQQAARIAEDQGWL
ncbi:MAG: response regulator transcription factor [Actinomycetes bacterium]